MPASTRCEPEAPGRRNGLLLRVFWINLAAAVSVVLLVAWFRQSFEWRWALRSFLIALVYANSIGLLIALVLTRAGFWLVRQRHPLDWLLLALAILLATVAGCLLAGLILVALGISAPGDYWKEFRSDVRISAIIALIFGVSAFFYESLRVRLERATLELRTRQLEEERARKLAAEARLSSLESRLHPHFLFNTLNSISSLIHEDPQRAEEIVGRLADLLRFALDAGQRRLVPLGREIKHVEDYLGIEKARFGSRLRFSIDVPAELEELAVPPLSLQTLVENSVKHAVAPRREGGEVRVLARAQDGLLWLEVMDDGPGFSLKSVPSGHGLDNLLARLSVLFGEAATLEVVRVDGGCVVRLRVPPSRPETV